MPISTSCPAREPCGLSENVGALPSARLRAFERRRDFSTRSAPATTVGSLRFVLNASNARAHLSEALFLLPDDVNFKNSEEITSFLSFSAKKLAKQVERMQIQLSEEKSRNRELSAQLTEAADYKARNFENYSALSHNQINPNSPEVRAAIPPRHCTHG